MKRIRPAGWLIAGMLLVSAAVTAVGAKKLLDVEKTLDDGAVSARTVLIDRRVDGGAESSGGGAYEGDVVGVVTFCHDEASSAPVYYGTGATVLEKGVGLAEDTGVLNERGNAVLFGHRDSALSALSGIQEGDAVTVETAAGMREYTVARTYVTSPEDPHIYDDPGELCLTFVTCYPFSFVGPAPERFVAVAVPAAPSP